MGSTNTHLLTGCIFVPKLNVNFLSITKCTERPNVTLTGSGNNLSLHFGGNEIKFDKQLQHGSGRLFATDIIPRDEEAIYLTMIFDQFHRIMGHPIIRVLKETTKVNNIQLTGVHNHPSEHCAQAKIRMKNIPKEVEQVATRKKEKDFYLILPGLELLDLQIIVFGSSSWMNILIFWSFFLKSKVEVTKKTISLLKGVKVQNIRLFRLTKLKHILRNRVS
jgi:hypothetical protein